MKKIILISLITLLLIIGYWLFGNPVFAASCTAEKPDKAPDLFQIDATKTSAKLYFTPVNNAVTGYTIIYGYERRQNDFGVSFPFGRFEGVISYTINNLSPNTKYYFRVRADNGCRQGWWSDTMSIRTDWDFKVYTKVKEANSKKLPKNLFFPISTQTEASVEGAMTEIPTPTVMIKKKIRQFNLVELIMNMIKNLYSIIKKDLET